jgi:hypothetical protein
MTFFSEYVNEFLDSNEIWEFLDQIKNCIFFFHVVFRTVSWLSISFAALQLTVCCETYLNHANFRRYIISCNLVNSLDFNT